jgi:ABC-type branched-subunit amino acid transport system substrate-binding protein
VRPVVVTSVPLTGPIAAAGADAAAAAQLALDDAGSPAGHRIVDSRPEDGAPQTLELLRGVAGDPSVVAYLGDWHSRWSLTSLPVLEVAGLAQISFTNTFSGLAGASFFNFMPSDDALAADLVRWMIELGVERPCLLNWDPDYGLDMRLLAAGPPRAAASPARRGSCTGPSRPAPSATRTPCSSAPRPSRRRPGRWRRSTPPLPARCCSVSTASTTPGSRPRCPTRCARACASARPPSEGDRLPPPGRAVMARLAASLGHEPDPHAVYAYEAMALALGALAAAGPDQAAIVERLKQTRGRESVLGRYDLDAHGATTLGRGGRLVADGARLVPA